MSNRIGSIGQNLRNPRSVSPNVFKEEQMKNPSIVAEFWEFLKVRKRYWLLPIVLVLFLFGALIVFTESSAIAPFIYTLF
jgi:hypothetical protein